MKHDSKHDKLTIRLGSSSPHRDTFDHIAGDVTITLDEADQLVMLTINRARLFIAQAIAAGVTVEGTELAASKPTGTIWHDVDSSMISAFRYDEAEEMLEVVFHRTGVYRYFEVPYHVYEGLLNAPSKGNYMRSMIIDFYPYEKKRSRR
jgi:hypothetical protein